MNKQKIVNDLNVAIPYFFFYEAILCVYSVIIQTLTASTALLYLMTLLAGYLLIRSGLELQKQKRMGIILYWIFIVMFLTGFMIRPFNYGIYDVMFVAIAVFITVANWNKWNKKTTKDNNLSR